MKWLFGVCVAAFFCCTVQAAETLQPTEWRWIEVATAGDQWRTSEGPATVEITGGKLHAALLYRKDDTDPYYDITGSIKMQRQPRIDVYGLVTATVKRGPTDFSPSFPVQGTYSKLLYDSENRKLWGTDSQEIIMLNDGFNMIGLVRETKIVR